jgi:hypothetical protein
MEIQATEISILLLMSCMLYVVTYLCRLIAGSHVTNEHALVPISNLCSMQFRLLKISLFSTFLFNFFL